MMTVLRYTENVKVTQIILKKKKSKPQTTSESRFLGSYYTIKIALFFLGFA